MTEHQRRVASSIDPRFLISAPLTADQLRRRARATEIMDKAAANGTGTENEPLRPPPREALGFLVCTNCTRDLRGYAEQTIGLCDDCLDG